MTTVFALTVVLVAGVLTGMTGFGFSVLAVPLLVLTYPPHQVVVIALALVPITSLALVLRPHLKGRVDTRLCLQLGLWSTLGLPIGVLLFTRSDPVWLTTLMGVVLIAFAAFDLYSPEDWRMPGPMVVPSGILGGLLAASTGLSGPAVAMYVHGRRLGHEELVATMAVYVGCVSLLGLVVLAANERVPIEAVGRVAGLAPAALVGVGLGRWWARRNHHSIERVTMHALGLMGLGVVLHGLLG